MPQEWYSVDAGPDYKPADNTIRSSVAAGPAKVRRRFTAVPEPMTLTGQLSERELAVLETFIKTTLQEALPFGWVNFRNGRPASYRFMAGWSSVNCKHYAADIWSITMQLEMLPN